MSGKSSLLKDISIIVGVALVVLVVVYLQRGNFRKIKVGEEAPDFTLYSVDGRKVTLSSFRGRVVLLNFWATWCNPCKEEIPSLNSLSEIMRGKNFVILAVSEDNRGADAVIPFIRKFNVKFPVLLDPSRKVGTLYSIGGVPETFLIDTSGKIRYKFIGPKNWSSKEMVSFIERYLK